MGLPRAALDALLQEGDWTRREPHQILNDRAAARESRRLHPMRGVGRANLDFSTRELLRNGQFGAMVGAETEEDRYRRFGWDRLEGPFYGPGGDENWDDDNRPKAFEAGNGLAFETERRRRDGPPPFWS